VSHAPIAWKHPPRILLVLRAGETRNSIVAVLRGQIAGLDGLRCEVEQYSNARDALARIRSGENPFDLLIAGLEARQEGEPDGADLSVAFRGRYPRAPLVLVTDESREDPRVAHCLRLPDSHLLRAPVTAFALEHKLSQLFRRGGERRPTILIVEDDAELRASLSDVLESEGFATVCAPGGAEAFEYLGENPTPVLILLDLMMARMDGLQFRRALLKDDAFAAIPVVVISANPKMRELTDKMSVQGYIAKPMDIEHLLHTVRKYALSH
jgi:CheY-like chemotaxis protein